MKGGGISEKYSDFEKLVKSPGKTSSVRKMFSEIAPRYDLMNRILSFGRDLSWRRLAVKRACFDEDDTILDLGAGTGDVAREIIRSKRFDKIYALDICDDLIFHGRKKRGLKDSEDTLLWIIGDGRYLPFPPESLDGIVAAFSVRNMADLPNVFSEMRRVLKQGGKVVILDMVKPGSRLFGLVFRFHFKFIVPVLGRLMGSEPDAYDYLLPSIENFYSAEQLEKTFVEMKFKNVNINEFMFKTVVLLNCTK